MNEIIEFYTNEENEKTVSARDLHKALEVKTRFKEWFSSNSKRFEQQVDFSYAVTTAHVGKGAKRDIDDYLMSIDMAKHIALMAGTDKGDEIRSYFIEAEKKLRQVVMQPTTAIDRSRLALESVVELDDRVTNLENNVPLSPTDYSVIGSEVSRRVNSYAKLHHIEDKGVLFKDLNSQIKQVTGAGNRSRIKAKDYDLVIQFIADWTPTTATLTLVKQTALEV